MSETDKKSDCIKQNFRNDEVPASHFALQIALQTMKERCQLLQQRLSAVEEENLRLRIDSQNNSRINSIKVPANEISKLEEKITQLTRQKCQLVDRITMVAKENNQLWTRLSRLTEANQSLGNHLTKISDTLNKHPIGEVSKIGESVLVADSGSKSDTDVKEESLEEISLKIIDTIRREKKVLEQQCEEMVELQTGAVSVEECGFTLMANGDIASGVIQDDRENDRDVMDDIKKLREKIKEEYKTLKDQQVGLKAAITSINIMIADKKRCTCKEKSTEDKNINKNSEIQTLDTSTLMSPLDEIQKQLKDVAEPPEINEFDGTFDPMTRQDEMNNMMENNPNDKYKDFDDRICPLCSKFYSQKVPFEEFHIHVLSHFNNESDDPDSLITNFEVIT
ncbi:C2H2-type zinc binding domain-containing protein spindle-F [Lycorma delicatula]|uniref:C2H2-type zinc binding domain-containing protein spindle-F n=1 Tax=Lycorma delicatula TaxID=130591 RepID=UPI003F5102AA